MWLLTSMGRPQIIRRLVDSYEWGEESQVLLVLWAGDGKLREYMNQTWPASWKTEIVPVKGNGPTYNEILERYPGESCYGFLADDAVPDVQGMLRELEFHAGDWNVAYANDKFHGESIPTMPCMGGKLVRAVGYLSPPNIVHAAIDCAWHEIGKRLDALRYRPELTYTHYHPILGKGKWDNTYQQAQIASFGYMDVFRSWLVGGACERACERARQARQAEMIGSLGT